MILAVDVGNTNIVLGLYEGKKLLHDWRISTNRSATADEYGMTFFNLFTHKGLKLEAVEGVIISSVVPPLMFALENMYRKYIKTGLSVRYENPR